MADGFTSFFTTPAGANEVTKLIFAVRRLLANAHTSMLVQVLACTNSGDVSPVGTVDVKILVNQIDGAGNTVSAGAVIYGVPYSRLQGGASAVILDPVAGDIGTVVFAEKDLSIVIANKGAGNPGSNRRNSVSDALFIGSTLNAVPNQYVRFSSAGIDLVSPTEVKATVGNATLDLTPSQLSLMVSGKGLTITASGTAFTGPVTGDSTAAFTGEGTFNGGHTVSAHTHGGVQSGGSSTSTPTG